MQVTLLRIDISSVSSVIVFMVQSELQARSFSALKGQLLQLGRRGVEE